MQGPIYVINYNKIYVEIVLKIPDSKISDHPNVGQTANCYQILKKTFKVVARCHPMQTE